jgi:alpha-tubulin suppressor-like RCC1 family protein
MSISAGCFYTVVLNHDGRLYISGFNVNGVLAQGTRRHERRFLSIHSAGSFLKLEGSLQHWLAVDDDWRLWACGNNHYGQLGLLEIETLFLRAVKGFSGERVASIACGLSHSLVCTAGGLLFAAGCNSDGQLGVGDFTNRSQFVAAYNQAINLLLFLQDVGLCDRDRTRLRSSLLVQRPDADTLQTRCRCSEATGS